MFAKCGFALALACAVATPVLAQDSELQRLRDEMKTLQRSYDERMQALEKRLEEAESRVKKTEETAKAAAPAPVTASPAPVAVTPPPAPAARTESAFNPAISLILQGTYARTSQDPNTFAITGFVPSGGEVGPPRRSFGLGESELVLSASIDPYFRGTAIFALTPENELEVEEA